MTEHAADCCAPHPGNAARVDLAGVAPAARTATPPRRESGSAAEFLVTGSLITMNDAMPRAALGEATS